MARELVVEHWPAIQRVATALETAETLGESSSAELREEAQSVAIYQLIEDAHGFRAGRCFRQPDHSDFILRYGAYLVRVDDE